MLAEVNDYFTQTVCDSYSTTFLNANIAVMMYCPYIWKNWIWNLEQIENKSYTMKGTSSEIVTGKVTLIINSSYTELSNSLTKVLHADWVVLLYPIWRLTLCRNSHGGVTVTTLCLHLKHTCMVTMHLHENSLLSGSSVLVCIVCLLCSDWLSLSPCDMLCWHIHNPLPFAYSLLCNIIIIFTYFTAIELLEA